MNGVSRFVSYVTDSLWHNQVHPSVSFNIGYSTHVVQHIYDGAGCLISSAGVGIERLTNRRWMGWCDRAIS